MHANEVNGEYNGEGAFSLVSMSEPPIPVRRHEQYAIRMLILVPLHAFPKEGSLRGRRLKGGDSFQGRRFAIDDGLCVSIVKTAINSLGRYDI